MASTSASKRNQSTKKFKLESDVKPPVRRNNKRVVASFRIIPTRNKGNKKTNNGKSQVFDNSKSIKNHATQSTSEDDSDSKVSGDNESKHTCSSCNENFTRRSEESDKHSRIHTGEKPFKCSECNFAFAHKGTLNKHMRCVHEKTKPFACAVCEKCFARKAYLIRHSILHTGEKPHKCLYCNKSFASKASLNVHLFTHRKEEPRACRGCGHAFIRKDCLIRHIRTVHRDQASLLLLQHNLAEKKTVIENGKLNDDKLCEAIRELLILLVYEKLLKNFGWPNSPIDTLLEAVIKQCNHEPVKCEDYNYFDRLRENVKLLFTVVIEDDSLKELLKNKTVDEVIVNDILQANA